MYCLAHVHLQARTAIAADVAFAAVRAAVAADAAAIAADAAAAAGLAGGGGAVLPGECGAVRHVDHDGRSV